MSGIIRDNSNETGADTGFIIEGGGATLQGTFSSNLQFLLGNPRQKKFPEFPCKITVK